MPMRPFDKSNLVTIATAPLSQALQMSSYAAPLMRPRLSENETLSSGIGWPPESVVDLGALSKGVSWALAIEGAAAICFYTLWHFRHLWHILR